MNRKGCYLVGLIAMLPVIYICAYVLFPAVRPEPTPSEVFVRLTGVLEPPSSIHDLKIHYLLDPLLGDGAATISFAVSESDGEALGRRFSFGSGKTFPPETWYLVSQVPVEISDAQYARYTDKLRNGIIKTNAARTVFVWHGGY